MLYDVNLHISYLYDTPVSGGRHIVRVLPLSIGGRQRLVAGTVGVTPGPGERIDHHDFFDWFLVRSRDAPDAVFAADPAIERVGHEGTWWLFRKRRE